MSYTSANTLTHRSQGDTGGAYSPVHPNENRYSEEQDGEDVDGNGVPRTVSGARTSGRRGSFPVARFFAEIFKSYKECLRVSPLLTKSITSCSIALIGEVFGSYIKSRILKQKFSVDPKRLRTFGLYGLLVTGPVLHWWYGLLDRTVRKMNYTGYSKTFAKLIFDRVMFGPPFVLLTVAFLQILQTNANLTKTIENVRATYANVLMMNEKIWTVAQAVNFQLIPVEYQVLFVNAVAIGWNTYLSMAQ